MCELDVHILNRPGVGSSICTPAPGPAIVSSGPAPELPSPGSTGSISTAVITAK